MCKKTLQVLLIILLGIGMNAQTAKKFPEDLSTAVFTTKYVVTDKKEITYVSHDADDGAWQFLSDEVVNDYMAVAKIISLAEVIKIDPSVLEVADLPLGYYAERKSKKHKWVVKKQR